MKLSAALVGVVFLLAGGHAVGATHCEDSRQMSSPDAVVSACTAEIQKNIGPRIDIAIDYVIRSHAFALKGDKDRAMADLNQALVVSPYLWEALTNRAVYYSNSGQLDLALKDYNDAILFHADNPDTYLNRAIVYSNLGQLDHAIADAEEAARRNPKYLKAHMFLVEIYLTAGKSEAAMNESAAALAAGAKPAALLNIRCWGRAVAGREPKLALEDCNQALLLAPNTASYLDSRGLVDLRLDDFEGAIQDYSAALATNPSLPTSLYGRSLAKRRKGDIAGANADAESAVKLDQRVAARFAGWGLTP